jgi:hypothetical protein
MTQIVAYWRGLVKYIIPMYIIDYKSDNMIWGLTCDFAEEIEEILFFDAATATANPRSGMTTRKATA